MNVTDHDDAAADELTDEEVQALAARLVAGDPVAFVRLLGTPVDP